MRSAAGETAEAKADLEALAADSTRNPDVHIAVVDAFIDLKHHAEAKALVLRLIATASAARDLERMSSLVDRVSRLAPLLVPEEGRAVAKAFEQAFTSMSKA
jgi:hypothetical protein